MKRCTPENRDTYEQDVIAPVMRQTMAAVGFLAILIAAAILLFGPACDSAAWR